MAVLSAQMMKRGGELNQTLQECLSRRARAKPYLLPRFVGVEESATIEERDSGFELVAQFANVAHPNFLSIYLSRGSAARHHNSLRSDRGR